MEAVRGRMVGSYSMQTEKVSKFANSCYSLLHLNVVV